MQLERMIADELGHPPGGARRLLEIAAELPEDLSRQVFTHASWSERRADSYERLAFLGDSVLGLAITSHLYPRLQAERFGAGRLTKIRAQVVSGASCRQVAESIGLGERLREAAPAGNDPGLIEALATERVLASVMEALIGACYLLKGYEPTAEAVIEAFAAQIQSALENPLDFKSTLQEQLARSGERARYEVIAESGPPHRRTFDVVAFAGERRLGSGSGLSKKHAEQEAARRALEQVLDK